MNGHERTAEKDSGSPQVSAGMDPALYRSVLEHLKAERYLDAQMCCRQALEANPDHAETQHLMALVCFNARQFDHAAEWAARAARRELKPGYLTTLGTALLNLKRNDEALKAFDEAVRLKPDDAGLWSNLGNASIEAGRGSEAIGSFRQAIEIDPRHLDANFKIGVLLHQQERLEEALAYFNRCEELLPDQAATLTIRALVLLGLNRFQEALSDNRRAQTLDPGNPYIRKNLGYSLLKLGRAQEALPWLDSALAIRPDFVDALNTRADALAELRRFEEAAAVYRSAKAAGPNHAEATWKLGLLQMLLGDFESGWAAREARFNLPSGPGPRPDLPRPLWLGKESVEGKTILVYSDEGLGDTIQFARYIPMLAARGARVILAVEEPVRSLLFGLEGVNACFRKPVHSLPDFDLHCPICSLPLAFGTRLDTVPSEPYLPPPAADRVQAWGRRLGAHDRLRVGLAWSGSQTHKGDHKRSMAARALSSILDVDATFVSLQKNPRPDDNAFLAGRPDIVDLTGHLNDLSETAALISCLDLVITVDTSVAHLAGALGRPTWILLPHMPDYRWLLDRDDSPWYPSVRLFRQSETREYASVLDRVRTELAALSSRHEKLHL